MGDERVRRLERGAAQGDLAARAGLLRERLRAGALAEERVRLAALLGDPAARLLSPPPPPRPASRPAVLARLLRRRDRIERPWVERLVGDDAEAGARVALAAAGTALPTYERRHPQESSARWALQTAVDVLRGRPRRPGPGGEDMTPTRLLLLRRVDLDGASYAALGSVYFAFAAAERLKFLRLGVEATPAQLGHQRGDAWDAVRCACRVTSAQAVRAAIGAALTPWLLGDGDPLQAAA